MNRSTLLQLAHDSIGEVLKAKRTIKREELLELHPLLKEIIPTTLNIYLENKLRGSYNEENLPLIDSIIKSAKKAAFEDKNFTPLTTSEYFHCEIEIVLTTPNGILSEKDTPILTKENQELAYLFRD